MILLAIVESYLDGYEHSRLRSEILLSSIEDNAAGIAIAEYRAIREGEVTPEIAQDVAENRREAAEALDELERLNPGGGEVAQVGQSLAAYEAAVEEELALIEAGRLDEARTVDEERVDPGFEALRELLEDAKTRYEAEAQRTNLFVKMATYGIALLAAIVLVAVIRLWQREAARRSEEEALEHSEERFRSLAQNSSDVVTVVDAEGTILYESPSLERVFGHKPEDLLGGDAFGRVHPDDLARVRGVFAEVLKRPGVTPPVEARVRHRDGSWRYVEAIGNNLLDDPGVGGIVINTRDITERKQAEEEVKEQRMFLRQVIDTDPNLVFVKDWDGRFTLVNQAVADLYGTTTEELLGRSDADFNANEEEVKTFLRMDREVMEKFRTRHVPEETVTDARTGERRWFQTVKVPLAPSGGEPRRVLGVSTEITMRKRAEGALKESEERFRALVENGLDLVSLCDADNTIRYISPSVRRILGYEPEEMIGLYVPSVVHPDDLEYATREAEKLLRNPAQNPAPVRYRRKDGSYAYLESVARNCLDDPSVEGIVVHSRDVTERVLAEEELRHSEERYRAVVEQAGEGIFLFDAGTKRILETNPALRGMLAYTAEDIERMMVYDLVPYDPESVDRNVERALERDHLLVGERRYLRKDGSFVEVEVGGSAISYGGKEVVCAVIRDITERKQADRMLRQQSVAMDNSIDGIAILDRHGLYTYLNDAHLKVYGYDAPEELLGKNYWKTLYGEDQLAWLEEHVLPALEEGGFWRGEMIGKRRDGSTFPQEISIASIEGSALVCVVRDITLRKRAEEALRESEERYRAVVERTADGVFLGDFETKRILESNAALQKMLGYTAEHLRGMSLYEMIVADPESIDRYSRRVLEEGSFIIGERRYRRKDGSVVDVDTSATLIPYGDKDVSCLIARDVTDRKRAEEELKRSLERLSALNEAGRVLGSTLEGAEIAKALLKSAEGVTDLAAAVVCSHDEQGGMRAEHVLGAEDVLRRARHTREARAAHRAAAESGERRKLSPRRLGPGTPPLVVLCVPLRVRDRVVGVLEVYGPEQALSERTTVETLTGLANQAASALENARLYAELAEREGQLRGLVGQLIMAQEEERRRVAREVHDGLTQMLVAAHQHLQSFADYHPPASPDAREELEWVMGVVQRTVGEARRVIADLRPTALDDFGLATALRLQADALSAEGWEVAYEESLGDERLPVEVETALFRVAQEAPTNVRKHACTRRARVELRRRGGVVDLRVRDWGRGFSPDADPLAGGAPGERVGLSSMRERVALLGGELEIDSRPGVGASIAAEIPLPWEGYPLGGA